ncbi:gamma-glutamyltransferase family protein [Amaricoccus solimangrovi]|uniref:Gamma-glutamyltransferase family protein n=1 Tax=Amaricoccus solimangrovi TaxID=2589815 RepID=A0A501WWT1_9RHOB|nr:gamma-glutamyltransferase family protein [Amaricoccus solimangrovi]TPE52715.1 gamma-glutamyltransferase family protein [Amaricoccus solimangrovi]
MPRLIPLARDFQTPGRSLVYAANGLCATSHPLASAVAIDTLRAGGNAVDAAIAAAVLLGICEPQMTGLGGDCFALVKPAGSEEIIGLNGSGRAPAALDVEALLGEGRIAMPIDTPAAVTVPGAVDAFCRLSADHGRLGLEACLAPAIRYATEGVPVAPRVALDWAEAAGRLRGDAREFYLLGGLPPRAGQLFRAPGQAEVLRRIAREGRAGFYEGEVAQDMVASLAALGGAHTADDFAAARAEYVTPIRSGYRGHELVELPPNGQGAAAMLLLAILERFDIAAMDPFGPARAHVEAEATRLAYAARDRFISDPETVGSALDHLLAPETADRLAALIDPDRAQAGLATIAAASVHRETIYITVVDAERMAVSLIYSIFHSFGSGLASAKFGINFHNRGAGFSLTPGHPNEARGGKRPMHTIIPGMLRRDGRLTMPFGVMGGAYQAAGHARLLSNVIDYGLDPQTAIDAPRAFCHDGTLSLERGYAEETAETLAALGHRVVRAAAPIGGAQAIVIDAEDGVLIGASDPRKDGCALGY